jgi:L-galactose dehydrogenase
MWTVPGMKYRLLGKTDLRLSVAGFGASPFGDVFGTTDPAEGLRAVHYAVERGINFFDVSPYYGATLAEVRLGHALKGCRERVVLATKCGRYGTDTFDFSEERITHGLEDSLRRLQTDHVDLLQAHDVEFADVDQIVEETIPAMRRLQKQGKARYIGITGYWPKNLVEIAAKAEVDSLLSYCRYDLLNTDMDESLMPFAEEHGIGVINASALHMGVLTEGGAPDWHPAPKEVLEAGRRVVELCRAKGRDVSEVALRFCFDHPGVTSTLVGMADRKTVDATLKALEMRSDPELLVEIREAIGEAYNVTWPSGLAENNG